MLRPALLALVVLQTTLQLATTVSGAGWVVRCKTHDNGGFLPFVQGKAMGGTGVGSWDASDCMWIDMEDWDDKKVYNICGKHTVKEKKVSVGCNYEEKKCLQGLFHGDKSKEIFWYDAQDSLKMIPKNAKMGEVKGFDSPMPCYNKYDVKYSDHGIFGGKISAASLLYCGDHP